MKLQTLPVNPLALCLKGVFSSVCGFIAVTWMNFVKLVFPTNWSVPLHHSFSSSKRCVTAHSKRIELNMENTEQLTRGLPWNKLIRGHLHGDDLAQSLMGLHRFDGEQISMSSYELETVYYLKWTQ